MGSYTIGTTQVIRGTDSTFKYLIYHHLTIIQIIADCLLNNGSVSNVPSEIIP